MSSIFPSLLPGQAVFAMADNAAHTAIDLTEKSTTSGSPLDAGIYVGLDVTWHNAGLGANLTPGHIIRAYYGVASDKTNGIYAGTYLVLPFDGTNEVSSHSLLIVE